MAGHDQDCYDVGGVQWARVSSALPPFVNPTYTARQVQEATMRYVEAGMPWEDALEKAASGGWEEHSENARDVGKEAHDAIEAYISGFRCAPMGPEVEAVMAQFHDWSQKEVEIFLLSEKRVVNEALGYAGTVDLVYQDKAGKVILGDIKTSGAFYPNYLLQCSAYYMALRHEQFSPAIQEVKCIRFPKDGSSWAVKAYTEADLERGCAAFAHLIDAYYLTAKRRLNNNPFVEKYWGKRGKK